MLSSLSEIATAQYLIGIDTITKNISEVSVNDVLEYLDISEE